MRPRNILYLDSLLMLYNIILKTAILKGVVSVNASRIGQAGKMDMKHSHYDEMHQAIAHDALLSSKKQRLIGPSGETNAWLIDMRRLLFRPDYLNYVAMLFLDMTATLGPFQVGGMELSAVPIVSAIMMKAAESGRNINGFVVRKERKTHGAGNAIEGMLNDLPIIIVDDVMNSGKSLEKVRAVLKDLGRDIAGAFVIVDYGSDAGIKWRRKHGISVIAPFMLSDFSLDVKAGSAPPVVNLFDEKWSIRGSDPNFHYLVPKSFPLTADGRVFYGADDGCFRCVDAITGVPIWAKHVQAKGHKNIWSAPAAHEGHVFFGSYDGNVYCLKAESGAEKWRFTGADWVGSSPALAPDLGLLFIGLEYAVEGKRGSIAALDIETGELMWEHGTTRYTHASPAYWSEKGLVACGSNNDEMFLFDAKTGAVKWQFKTDASTTKGSIRHAPAFDPIRGHLITGCANGRIYVIDIETGREVWSVQTDNTIYTVPLVVGDFSYVGSTDKCLYILDLSKRVVKRKIYTGSKVFSPASFINGAVYFGSCNGLIYRIEPTTGNITGTHQLPDAVTNRVAYSSEAGLYYALTYTNHLFALSPSLELLQLDRALS